MKSMKFYLLLLVLPCLALQCNKDKDEPNPDNGNNNKEQLPPATQSGENTFGCLVNGEVWRPKEKGFYANKIAAGYGRGSLFISALKQIENKEGEVIIDEAVNIHIQKKAFLEKKHTLTYKTYPGKWAEFENDLETCKFSGDIYTASYKTDSINKGYVKLMRVDSIKNIISGRFEFTAVNDSCGNVDTISITKGRFDIKYAY